MGIYVEWVEFYVGSISVYTCGCRVLSTANHVRLSRYTHYIKNNALSLTSILMHSNFTKAVEIGLYENVVGCIAISVWLTTGQLDCFRTTGNVTSQIVRRCHWEGVASVSHNTGGRHGYEPGWRQENRPWFSTVTGFVTHGSFMLDSDKVLWSFPYICTCTCVYSYLRLLTKSIIIPLKHNRYLLKW